MGRSVKKKDATPFTTLVSLVSLLTIVMHRESEILTKASPFTTPAQRCPLVIEVSAGHVHLLGWYQRVPSSCWLAAFGPRPYGLYCSVPSLHFVISKLIALVLSCAACPAIPLAGPEEVSDSCRRRDFMDQVLNPSIPPDNWAVDTPSGLLQVHLVPYSVSWQVSLFLHFSFKTVQESV